MFRENLAEAVQIVAPQSLNVSKISSKSAFQPTRSRLANYGGGGGGGGTEEISVEEALAHTTIPRGQSRQLHFFETGSNKLHIVSVDGRKGRERVVTIN